MPSRKKNLQMLLVLDHTSTLNNTKERPWNKKKPKRDIERTLEAIHKPSDREAYYLELH